MTSAARALLVVLLGCGVGVACAEEVEIGGSEPVTAGSAEASRPKADAGAADTGPPKVEFQESDFAETERSRDPFRSYARMFADEARTKVRSQREVVLDQYAIDELKLIGIVTRIDPAKAMLVDPTGRGHVVQRGQFIGRPERVQGGGQAGAEYEINWRIDRIREGDVVLVREDPALPDVPSATKILPLRPEGTIIASEIAGG